MQDKVTKYPKYFYEIMQQTKQAGFDQLSDDKLGSLLTTLVASKPNSKILELGTGSGLSTVWLLAGMDNNSTLQTVDNDENLVNIAKQYLQDDKRVEFFIENGEDLILRTEPNSIDFIFADTWPGKYNYLEELLNLLKGGGIYLIDDMLPQENWPEGHNIKADNLIQYLENREDFNCVKLNWSTGIIICTKK
ncbi:O-methyltransferase [Bathymodiolus thermophilus thioautotrophic gill symbiont]|uniref:O-methyltransferase n=1 Tax=Bathymodiolus thermophilus thioautotrophic gill symbiont TaxID=2360 RepID=UPI000F090F52|nr:class I SAM-dependent methyltransferase [Bathymodiolus thermophilus thioautotrophic gill symbiont]